MRLVVAIVIKDGQVVKYATNEHAVCKREGYPTGEGYELCDGCNYSNHAEYKAVQSLKGDDLYLFGHTYACDPCKEAMREANVTLHII